ncbi:hypothetical protein BS47DRAFT_1398057 [Hydnum rufescens UP504]|uniref:Uncharacterized protein n=1 Tax=Hydnum rufescens UP504 TaxID=1448309 RepID=A0A9P6ALJ2_9AGAM|nr:hypothetical protein BS47DRAFT_1398057 [Hydnum rufescens UP504]
MALGCFCGIRAAQEVVNCKEELKRCAAEHSNLRQWLETEYLATQFVFNHSTNVCVQHFALQRLHQFFDLVSIWQKDLDGVPSNASSGGISTFLPEIPPPIPGMDAWDHEVPHLMGLDEEGYSRSDASERDIESDAGGSLLSDEEQLDFSFDVDIMSKS